MKRWKRNDNSCVLNCLAVVQVHNGEALAVGPAARRTDHSARGAGFQNKEACLLAPTLLDRRGGCDPTHTGCWALLLALLFGSHRCCLSVALMAMSKAHAINPAHSAATHAPRFKGGGGSDPSPLGQQGGAPHHRNNARAKLLTQSSTQNETLGAFWAKFCRDWQKIRHKAPEKTVTFWGPRCPTLSWAGPLGRWEGGPGLFWPRLAPWAQRLPWCTVRPCGASPPLQPGGDARCRWRFLRIGSFFLSAGYSPTSI